MFTLQRVKEKIRINNIPVEMIPQETAREVILAPLEITGDNNSFGITYRPLLFSYHH